MPRWQETRGREGWSNGGRVHSSLKQVWACRRRSAPVLSVSLILLIFKFLYIFAKYVPKHTLMRKNTSQVSERIGAHLHAIWCRQKKRAGLSEFSAVTPLPITLSSLECLFVCVRVRACSHRLRGAMMGADACSFTLGRCEHIHHRGLPSLATPWLLLPICITAALCLAFAAFVLCKLEKIQHLRTGN